MRRSSRLVLCCLLVSLGSGCKAATQMRGRIAGVRNIAELAAQNGAMKCAPRELALARAHLEFSELALAEGSLSLAEAQLDTAETNAKAALGQSPPEHCTAGAPQPGDRDGDGYLDTADQCPDAPEPFNALQDEDGCPDEPDTDGDGLVDSKDPCPVLAEDVDQYLDGDGCPELDNDLDGIEDAKDECPTEPEDPEGYEDQNGCPDLDNDGDEVPDLDDECPNTPGQKEQAPKGCPIKPALVVVTDCEVKITQQIHFETGKDKIKPESYPILDAVVDVLEKSSAIKLQIQGHTDDVGTNKANMSLSDRRAASVRKYLVAKGIAVDRLQSLGFGEEVPLVENNSTENRALNRRVQFMRTEGHKAGCGEVKNEAESASSPSTSSGSP
jgi:OmpA-OmpF porin, OOP family